MEEPLPLHDEPKDEAVRAALPLGTFTGVTTADARQSLDADDDEASEGLRVQRVIENSPGDVAGVQEDDILLDVSVDGAPARPLRWVSEWRQVELGAPVGARLLVRLDRAGLIRTAVVVAVPRVRASDRVPVQRIREEKRVGVVVRTATEVEARAADLGPGGGAVIVGLSGASPWRGAGLRFGDVIAKIDGREVAQPQEVVSAIQEARAHAVIEAEVVRDGVRSAFTLPVTRRDQELREISIPLIYSFERARGATEVSCFLGAVTHRTTAAAWEWRILWIISFSGGDADRLEEISE